ncbi:MAG: alpha/beta hydrolase [Arenicellales bacterium]|nr:alpha/beta hydrolase [Arenicellales bacterium]
MAILVVTNRNINDSNATDVSLFGESTNAKGPSEIRLAWAQFNNGDWELELIEEPPVLTPYTVPSRDVFASCVDSLQDTGRSCVLYVHGYNKTFRDTLDQACIVHDEYEVATVVFSWPSNPGGIIVTEYAKARAIAQNSIAAFDRIIGLLDRYVRTEAPDDCAISFNCLVHSLGGFILESFIRSPIFGGQTRLFDNIVVHQADVDRDQHTEWMQKMQFARRIYVTTNERDAVLNASDIVNPDRLGNTLHGPILDRPFYIDFTDAEEVGKTHQLFGEAIDNPHIKDFFQYALTGQAAHTGAGVSFDLNSGFFKVV